MDPRSPESLAEASDSSAAAAVSLFSLSVFMLSCSSCVTFCEAEYICAAHIIKCSDSYVFTKRVKFNNPKWELIQNDASAIDQ